jgi:hypothetical protein
MIVNSYYLLHPIEVIEKINLFRLISVANNLHAVVDRVKISLAHGQKVWVKLYRLAVYHDGKLLGATYKLAGCKPQRSLVSFSV